MILITIIFCNIFLENSLKYQKFNKDSIWTNALPKKLLKIMCEIYEMV